MEKFVIPAIIILSVLLVFGLIYFLIGRLLKNRISLTEKINAVADLLGGSDCGLCGEDNCLTCAKQIVEGKKHVNICPFAGFSNTEEINTITGFKIRPNIKKVAFVACKGGTKCRNKFKYIGDNTCSAQQLVHNGSKMCNYGCLGCGDCVKACRYNAIKINERGVAFVDRDLCTGCGACIEACPRDIIKFISVSHPVAVVCNNKAIDSSESYCKVGCRKCNLCVKYCPEKAITIVDNIPVIDYDKCTGCNVCVHVCPAHTISRLKVKK